MTLLIWPDDPFRKMCEKSSTFSKNLFEVEKETHLAEERDREGGGRDDLGQEEEEHGEGEQDGDGEGDLLPRVRRQVEHQHYSEGIAHPVSPVTISDSTV